MSLHALPVLCHAGDSCPEARMKLVNPGSPVLVVESPGKVWPCWSSCIMCHSLKGASCISSGVQESQPLPRSSSLASFVSQPCGCKLGPQEMYLEAHMSRGACMFIGCVSVCTGAYSLMYVVSWHKYCSVPWNPMYVSGMYIFIGNLWIIRLCKYETKCVVCIRKHV